MGVGKKFYPYWQKYIAEAETEGCCKRIPGGIPIDFQIGGSNPSKIFLMHNLNQAEKRMLDLWNKCHRAIVKDWKEEEDLEEILATLMPSKYTYPMRIFAYFELRGIMMVLDDQQFEEVIEKEGVQILSTEAAMSFSERGCGMLVSGATYFVSDEDMQKLAKYGDMGKGQITVLEEPITTTLKHFRGFKYLIEEKVLGGAPEAEWFEQVPEIREYNRDVRRILAGKKPRKRKPKPPPTKQLELSMI
jgi:hypothetical protein